MEQLDFIINGAETKRYHTCPVLREQTVGTHSFGVAMLYSMMAAEGCEVGGVMQGLTLPGIMAALVHDLAEHKMGDLPAPVKRNLPDIKTSEQVTVSFRSVWDGMEQEMLTSVGLDWEHLLAPHEKRWLKLADAMEGALYCIRELQMGNTLIHTPFRNFRSYIRQLSDFDHMDFIAGEAEPNVEQQIIMYIDDMWEQANGRV